MTNVFQMKLTYARYNSSVQLAVQIHLKCSSFGNPSWQHQVQWVMVMPRVIKYSQYEEYHVKPHAAGVVRLWYFHLSSHQYHVHSEWIISYWMSLNSLYGIDYIPLFSVLSGLHQEVNTSRDILTGLPYMQKLCTLTRNALSDKKKGGFTPQPQQRRNIFVASVEFTLYVCAKLEEFSSWYERCCVFCIHHFFLNLWI